MVKFVTTPLTVAAVIALTALYAGYGSVMNERARTKKEAAYVRLYASNYHQELLLGITKQGYPDRELDQLFTQLDTKSEAYCAVLFKERPFQLNVVKSYIGPKYVETFTKATRYSLQSVTAGCHNFYMMNDRKTDLDFRVLASLYPNTVKECYSVGFMQPYIMHNILNCRTLQMVDIDWRILELHHQFINMIKNGEFGNPDRFYEKVRSFRLPRQAYEKRINLSNRKDRFCYGRQGSLCADHIQNFQNTYRSLTKIDLNLSPLHTANFARSESGQNLKVFFLSNAIEDMYTTPAQFNTLLQTIHDSLFTGQKLVAIHHAGSKAAFGLYEISKKVDGPSVKTICKDPYPNRRPGITTGYYKTHFERVTPTQRPPTCRYFMKTLPPSYL